MRRKRYPLPSIERNITQEARLVPAPREHRQRHGYRHVNTNLTDFDLVLKFTSSGPTLREDGCSVAIRVSVNDGQCVVQRIRLEDDQSRPEDLLPERESSMSIR